MDQCFRISSFQQVITRKGYCITFLTENDLRDPRMYGEWIRAYCPIHGSDHQRSLSINPANGFGLCFCCKARVLVKEFNPPAVETLLRQKNEGYVSQYKPRGDLFHHFKRPVQPTPRRLRLSQPVPRAWQEKECQVLLQLYEQGTLRIERPAAKEAQAYLEARAIPLEIAAATGVGYLEPKSAVKYGEKLLQRWEDRLLFPLLTGFQSPAMLGFAGRLLTGWRSCTDEQAHKLLLDEQRKPRWLKTSPAGWFWAVREPPEEPICPLIIVEGPFDRLSLLAGGFAATEVVALVGTALGMPLPLNMLSSVLLALDSDVGGEGAAFRLQAQIEAQDIPCERCFPSLVSGKDWNERWRSHGADGLDALYAHQALMAQHIS